MIPKLYAREVEESGKQLLLIRVVYERSTVKSRNELRLDGN